MIRVFLAVFISLICSGNVLAEFQPVLCERGEQIYFMGQKFEPPKKWLLGSSQRHVFSIDQGSSKIVLGPEYARRVKDCGVMDANIDAINVTASCKSHFSFYADRQGGTVELKVIAQGTDQPIGSTAEESGGWLIFWKNRFTGCMASKPQF